MTYFLVCREVLPGKMKKAKLKEEVEEAENLLTKYLLKFHKRP
jgi:hypothetical protein